MTWDPDQHDDHAIVRYEGRPNEADRPAEKTRMRRFLEFLRLLPRKTDEVAVAYDDAEVVEKSNEAVKIAAQAAEMAARADLTRTVEVTVVNEEIERIVTNRSLPMEAVRMQLRTLAKAHPEILEQSDKIDQLIERLRLQRGLRVQIVEDQPAASGPPRASPPGE